VKIQREVNIQWESFPKNKRLPEPLLEVVKAFEVVQDDISSEKNDSKMGSGKTSLASNEVLRIVASGLIKIGYDVESSKKSDGTINVPVLYGRNGKTEKSFQADAYNKTEGIVIEVEAGRAVTNHQFLKDLFQACMMDSVDHLVIAVRIVYKKHKDFESVCTFFDTLYTSDRLRLPLESVLIIGY
jgi:hypothetical protein